MSKHLTDAKKSEHKKYPGFDLWKECLDDNPAAWREMKKYNVLDVIATEQLYLKQLPWISNHPNVNAYSMREDITCPKCGSPKLQARGFAVTQVGKYQRLQCQACGGWSKCKVNLLSTDKRKSLLVSQ
jgi:DNA-directed RNA polymerase subunit RPC12/RpoP